MKFLNRGFGIKELLSYSKTRWLSLLPAIERILKLYVALKSFFLSEEKAPKTLLDFFNNSLSEAYLWFVHSQASAIHNQILKIEGRTKSVVEVLDVLEVTLQLAEEKRNSKFLPASVKLIKKKKMNLVYQVCNRYKNFMMIQLNFMKHWLAI